MFRKIAVKRETWYTQAYQVSLFTAKNRKKAPSSSLLARFFLLRAYQSSLFTASTEQKASSSLLLASFSLLRAYQSSLFTASAEQKASLSLFLVSLMLLDECLRILLMAWLSYFLRSRRKICQSCHEFCPNSTPLGVKYW